MIFSNVFYLFQNHFFFYPRGYCFPIILIICLSTYTKPPTKLSQPYVPAGLSGWYKITFHSLYSLFTSLLFLDGVQESLRLIGIELFSTWNIEFLFCYIYHCKKCYCFKLCFFKLLLKFKNPFINSKFSNDSSDVLWSLAFFFITAIVVSFCLI